MTALGFIGFYEAGEIYYSLCILLNLISFSITNVTIARAAAYRGGEVVNQEHTLVGNERATQWFARKFEMRAIKWRTINVTTKAFF